MKHSLKLIQWIFFGVLTGTFAYSSLVSTEAPTLEGISTDLKFRLRGPSPLKSELTLVEVDNRTLEQFPEYGRWPWQRDPQAFLIYSILQYQPRLLVLDIIYSQSESVRIPLELEEDLRKMGRADLVARYSPEAKLLKTLNHYRDRMVLASGAESLCIKDCGTGATADSSDVEIAKWALPSSAADLPIIENPILNLHEYNEVARHFGFSIAQPGSDGIFRKIFLQYKLNNRVYPSLALSSVSALDSAFPEPSDNNPQINFKTDIRQNHSISATDVILAEQNSSAGEKLKAQLKEKLKDKIVVLGVTASAAGDSHTTPLGILSGPEVLLTTIDNLMSHDFFSGPGKTLSLLLVGLAALFFAGLQKFKARFSSRNLVIFFAVGGLALAAFDAWCFSHFINLPSVWLYLFLTGTLFLVIYEKYILVEVQKNFIKSAFSKYISPDFVNEILSNPEKLKIGGQKKELTIMFSDIRSFTTFSEKMDAKTLGEFLHEYLDEMTEIVFASRGTLDKYIGDAVMAFWGDPLLATDHAYSACESAKKMMTWIRLKQPYFMEKYGIDLQVGIGIHTGPVSVGNMGSSKSLGYTAIGDAVNLTSRLEGATKEYGVSILTTEETLKQIVQSQKNLPSHRLLDSLKVKGKNKSVQIVQIFESEAPAELLSEFKNAMQNYSTQKWAEAIRGFENCNSFHRIAFSEEDKVSLIFIERCHEWQKEFPPADWDGSWKLTSK